MQTPVSWEGFFVLQESTYQHAARAFPLYRTQWIHGKGLNVDRVLRAHIVLFNATQSVPGDNVATL